MYKTLLFSGNVKRNLSYLTGCAGKEKVNQIIYLGGNDQRDGIRWLRHVKANCSGEINVLAVPSLFNIQLLENTKPPGMDEIYFSHCRDGFNENDGRFLQEMKNNPFLNIDLHNTQNAVAIGGGFAGRLPPEVDIIDENKRRTAFNVDETKHVIQNFWYMTNSDKQYEIILRGNGTVPQMAFFIGNGKTKQKLKSMQIESVHELSNEIVLNTVKSNEKYTLEPDNMFMITPGAYVDGHVAIIETKKKIGLGKSGYKTEVKFTTI